ncbi:hypothetical protein [Gloeobacter morelensis]|uniref:hypothetical protein n=1 Tax=Gloeobacter morelensis TaxID=2907343 RepID=UPI001E29CA9B|nr:hypothetical protein [Gloeobacter morelensis]UFP97229.1 hypothetical protein ISF26_24210 [Gloeobacter morelensis MG652769]
MSHNRSWIAAAAAAFALNASPAAAQTGYWPLDQLISSIGGATLDGLVSRNSSSLNGLFNNALSQLFTQAANQLNGAYNEASAYNGYNPIKILQSGVSIDQTTQAGMVIPDEVYNQIIADVESRFGTYVSSASVAPAMMRDAQRRAESAGLYNDTTDENGVLQPGFLTVRGAQKRNDALVQLNESSQGLQDEVNNFQQTSLQSASTTYQDAVTVLDETAGMYDAMPEAAANGQAQISSAAKTAQSQPSTQLVLKQMATELEAFGKLTADIASAEARAKAKEMAARSKENLARQNEVAAAQVAAAVQVYNAKQLTEILKNQTAQIEEAKLLRLAQNRVGQSIDEQKKIDAFNASYLTQGAIDNADMLGLTLKNQAFEEP